MMRINDDDDDDDVPCIHVKNCTLKAVHSSMVDMNVKNVYKEEWYDPVSVNEIDSASVVKEMIAMM